MTPIFDRYVEPGRRAALTCAAVIGASHGSADSAAPTVLIGAAEFQTAGGSTVMPNRHHRTYVGGTVNDNGFHDVD